MYPTQRKCTCSIRVSKVLQREFHPFLAPHLGELERRAKAYPEELSSPLFECHTSYFGARKYVFVPRLMEEIKGLDPVKSEPVELVSPSAPYYFQLLSLLDPCRMQLP
jgi:hypothetical protein